MLISLIFILASLMILFSLKERFDRKSATFKYSVIGLLAILIASILTMEFFIYLHQRILEFIEATTKIPIIIVIIFLAGVTYLIWKALFFLVRCNKEDFQKFIQETLIPRAKETFKEVKETSKIGWQGLRQSFLKNPFKKKDPKENIKVSKPK